MSSSDRTKPAASLSDASHERVDILLVDDQPRNLAALTAILDRPGYNCVLATSGEDALRLVLARPFALILLDVVMPGMDGLEVAALIKARERSRGIPIIFLTAAGEDLERVHQAYSLGAVDYLQKPVQPHIVRAKVGVFAELYRTTEKVKRQAELLREHDRRERERELAEVRSAGERRYRDLAESIPQLVWHANLRGELTYFTKRWHEYTGIALDGATRIDWLGVIHPDDRDAFARHWRSSVLGSHEFQAECRLRRADGMYKWHLCQALPNAGPTLETAGWMGTFTDIDAQKRADEERARLLLLAEAARAKAEQMQRCMAILAQVSSLLNESLDVERVLDSVARHLVETMCAACSIELLDEQGRMMPVAAAESSEHASPARSPADGEIGERTLLVPVAGRGAAIGTLSVVRRESAELSREEEAALVGDICHRVATFVENARLYVKANRAVEARDEFLSIASHELRTPLTSLCLQIQSLGRSARGEARAPLSPSVAARQIELAERQVSRLSTLIAALFDVSRIASGQVALDVVEVDLCQTVRDVGARFAEPCAEEGSELTVLANGSIVGHWDALRIEQIVGNLVANALKYGAGRPITLSATFEGRSAVVVVKDQGIGIPPEDHARIFERFERAASPVSYGGLGLGLYIARSLVVAHGGTIEVRSERGKGAEFRLTLPTESPSAVAGGTQRVIKPAQSQNS